MIRVIFISLSLILSFSRCGTSAEGGHDDRLAAAARSGDLITIANLVRSGVDVNSAVGENGWTPLHHAVHKSQRASLNALLSLGADPNRSGKRGFTPLMMAAGYGDTESVRMLLAAGADPNLARKNGDTALTLAITGVADIDNFTVGQCQKESVRAILAAAPKAKAELSRSGVWLARFGGCNDVVNQLARR